MRYFVTFDISPKNKFKKTLHKLLFDILNSGDDYIDTPTLITKVKLAKNVKKNSCFLVSTFTIYFFKFFSL